MYPKRTTAITPVPIKAHFFQLAIPPPDLFLWGPLVVGKGEYLRDEDLNILSLAYRLSPADLDRSIRGRRRGIVFEEIFDRDRQRGETGGKNFLP